MIVFKTGGTSLFLTPGFILGLFHGFKAGPYLDASSPVRRLLWRLAHAHGALLSLVHLAFAAYLNTRIERPPGPLQLASRALTGGSILLPVSFFPGGPSIHEGDPGLLA